MNAKKTPIEDGRAYWFLDALVIVHSRYSESGLCFLETLSSPGPGAPLHVHPDQEEGFYVVDGSLRVYVGSEVIDLAPGQFALAPRGIPHTFEVTSEGPTRDLSWINGPFDEFLEAVAVPAKELRLPRPEDLPAEEGDPEEFARLAAAVGVTVLGPPGMLPTELPEYA